MKISKSDVPWSLFALFLLGYLAVVGTLLAGGTWIVLAVWRAVMG